MEAMAINALNSFSVIAFTKISSMSLQSFGLFGTCEIPYQMLVIASPGTFSDIFVTTVLQYLLTVRNLSYSIAFSSLRGSGCAVVGR